MESACKKWITVLTMCPSDSVVGAQLEACLEDYEPEASRKSVLMSVIGIKSPSTAVSRANVLTKYLEWVYSCQPGIEKPFQESLVWRYFQRLQSSGAAPTRASGTMSSFRYAHHVFGYELPSILQSRKLVGIGEIMLSEKVPLQQAQVISVKEVLMLHSILKDSDADVFVRANVAYLLLCLQCVDHIVRDHSPEGGYTEVFTKYIKVP